MRSLTTLKLPERLKARLAAQAEAEGKTAHAYMIEALAERADRADGRARYLANGERALVEYERTGVAYAMKDVEQYSMALSAGRNPRRPKPQRIGAKKR